MQFDGNILENNRQLLKIAKEFYPRAARVSVTIDSSETSVFCKFRVLSIGETIDFDTIFEKEEFSDLTDIFLEKLLFKAKAELDVKKAELAKHQETTSRIEAQINEKQIIYDRLSSIKNNGFAE